MVLEARRADDSMRDDQGGVQAGMHRGVSTPGGVGACTFHILYEVIVRLKLLRGAASIRGRMVHNLENWGELAGVALVGVEGGRWTCLRP